MRVVEYDPSRRADVADLMGARLGRAAGRGGARVVLRAEPGSRRPRCCSPRRTGRRSPRPRSASSACRSAARASRSGCRFASPPTRPTAAAASSPSSRPANEERVRDLGVRLLLTVPNAASAPVFLNRLGWKPLPPLRVWARLRLRLRRAARQAGRAVRLRPDRRIRAGATSCCATPTGSTGASPTRRRAYTLVEGEGYAVGGPSRPIRRRRGRRGRVPARRRCGDRRSAS